MQENRGMQRHPSSPIKAFVAVLAVVLGFPLSAIAQGNFGTFRYGDPPVVTMTVTGVYSNSLPSGYYPVLVEIDNRSGEEFTANLNFTAREGRYRWEEKYDSSFRVKADAASTATHSLLVPQALSGTASTRHYGGYGGIDLNIRSSGRVDHGHVGGGMDLSFDATAFSAGAHRLTHSALNGAMVRPSRGARSHHSTGLFGTQFDPVQLPSDWLGYSGLDALILTEDDWTDVPQAARSAIFDWVRLGGSLVVYPNTSGRSLSELGMPKIAQRDGMVNRLGLGRIMVAEPSTSGTVDTSPAGNIPAMKTSRSERYLSDYDSSWQPGIDLGKRRLAHAQVVIILLLFAVLVGPVNLFVWAKPGKRHRLFFTTPLISIAASLLLAGLILIQDGFGGKGSRNTLVFTDPTTNKAYVIQEQASRTGVLLRTVFEPDPKALMVPLEWGRSTGGPSGQESRAFDLRGERHSGDWFGSRSDQAQYIETAIPSRARLELQPGSGPPKLTSSFPFELARVFYIDDSGDCWQAQSVGTGVTTTMAKTNRSDFDTWLSDQSVRFGSSVARHLRNMPLRAGSGGQFFATAGDIGLLSPETLDSVRWKTQHNIITGPVVPVSN